MKNTQNAPVTAPVTVTVTNTGAGFRASLPSAGVVGAAFIRPLSHILAFLLLLQCVFMAGFLLLPLLPASPFLSKTLIGIEFEGGNSKEKKALTVTFMLPHCYQNGGNSQVTDSLKYYFTVTVQTPYYSDS